MSKHESHFNNFCSVDPKVMKQQTCTSPCQAHFKPKVEWWVYGLKEFQHDHVQTFQNIIQLQYGYFT